MSEKQNCCDVHGRYPKCTLSFIVDASSACVFAELPDCAGRVFGNLCFDMNAIRDAIKTEERA
jgi:hypothetical protein